MFPIECQVALLNVKVKLQVFDQMSSPGSISELLNRIDFDTEVVSRKMFHIEI